jgi:hypothetical protein
MILVLAIAVAVAAAGCKALPKPQVPNLGGSITSSSVSR